jgi:hypothetical protein
MCYMTHISTDCPHDLGQSNTDLLRFRKQTDANTDPCIGLLAFPNKWFVESIAECSCTFRHLHPSCIQLGFMEPQDWCEEDPEAVAATLELYARLVSLLESGYQVDLIDRWFDATPESITTLEVSLDVVSAQAFTLFEGYKFILKKGSPNQTSVDISQPCGLPKPPM